MKILFLIPPDILALEGSVSTSINKARGYYPSLGLLYVAAHYEKATGVTPAFIDAPPEGLLPDDILRQFREIKPDMVAMSVTTFTLLSGLFIADLLKKERPEVKICMGGAHVNLYPKETLQQPSVDYVVFGEGEKTFTKLVITLEEDGISSGKLGSILGLGWKLNGDIRVNPENTELLDLNTIPFPASHLVDITKYNSFVSKGNRFFPIQASRGCPAGCTFCDIRKTTYRFRSPESVVSEIEQLMEMGVDDLFFVDDTLTVNKQNVIAMCDLICKRGLKINYKVLARADMINPETLAALKRSGCYRINYGIETATPRLLKYIEKGLSLEKIERACKLTHDAGIGFQAYLMIGIPTETKEEMFATVELAKRIKPDYAHFSICAPYPKTEMTKRLLSDGTIPYDYWQEFAENPTPDFKIKFWNKDFSDDELHQLQDECQARFYRNFSYIVKQITQIKSWSDLMVRVNVGAKVLTKQLR